MKNRVIKFRVWDGEKMLDNNHFTILNHLEEDGGTVQAATVEDKDCTLLQYTGLKDKNGEEIFESDIVEFSDWRDDEPIKVNAIIEYKGGAFYPICTAPDELFEIIGNIYENPELLKL